MNRMEVTGNLKEGQEIMRNHTKSYDIYGNHMKS